VVVGADYNYAGLIGLFDILRANKRGGAIHLHIILDKIGGYFMRKLIAVLVIAAILGVILYRNSDPRIAIGGITKNGPIKSGVLVYRVYLLGLIPVGEAVFSRGESQVYKGVKVYHLTAKADSLGYISTFFKASAILDSYIDTLSLNPIEFQQRLAVPGKPEVVKTAFYDAARGSMTINSVERSIYPDTKDPLSAMLCIQRMDFSKMRDFEMSLNSNQKNYVLKGQAEAYDIKVGQKIHNAVMAKAQISRRDKNNPYHKSDITMILLRDKENIPVLIKVVASGFYICARLIEIK
jgi:hypothetical protein